MNLFFETFFCIFLPVLPVCLADAFIVWVHASAGMKLSIHTLSGVYIQSFDIPCRFHQNLLILFNRLKLFESCLFA